MLIRSAYWTGRPADGQAARFREMVAGELVPAMRRFPGVQAVKALWPEHRDDGAPPIHCQVVVEFADADGKAAAALFDGQLTHIDFSVD